MFAFNRDGMLKFCVNRHRREAKALKDRKKAIHFLLFFVVAVILSYGFVDLRFTMNRQHPPATVAALTAGVAERGCQYRILVPRIIRYLYERTDETPLTQKKWLWFYGFDSPPERTASRQRPTPSLIDIYLPPEEAADYRDFLKLAKGMEFLSVLLLIIAFRYYISLFIENRTACTLLSFSLFYVLPFNFLFNYFYYQSLFYPYDIPSMLFFTLGLIFIYKKNWPLYYFIFALGTFNRETTAFLTMTYVFTALGKDRLKTIASHSLAQLAIWVAIKSYVYSLYGGNQAEDPNIRLFKFSWGGNSHFFFKENPVEAYTYFFRTMGYLWIPVLFFFRRIREDFVRRSLLVLVPFTIGMAIVANIHELRIWGEMIPIVLSAFLLIVKGMFERAAPGKAKTS